MQGVWMTWPQRIEQDTYQIGGWIPVPTLGLVAVNGYLIKGEQPVLIDTGFGQVRDQFVHSVSSLIDLEDLRWLVLTHTDPDHVGAYDRLLEVAPNARVVTSFVGMAKLDLQLHTVPVERILLLNPGEQLDVGDRQLLARAPPTFDAPETTMFFDTKTRVLFSSDCFGGALQDSVERADALEAAELRAGEQRWASLDAPWLRGIAPRYFQTKLDEVRTLAPSTIASSHLPPAYGMTDQLLENLASTITAEPWHSPNQAAFEAMMAAAQP